MTTRQALRRLIGPGDPTGGYTMVPGAYDTLTARLVEAAGFAAVYLTGGGYSRASGYPDLIVRHHLGQPVERFLVQASERGGRKSKH